MTEGMIKRAVAACAARGDVFAIHYRSVKDETLEFIKGYTDDYEMLKDKHWWKAKMGYTTKRLYVLDK